MFKGALVQGTQPFQETEQSAWPEMGESETKRESKHESEDAGTCSRQKSWKYTRCLKPPRARSLLWGLYDKCPGRTTSGAQPKLTPNQGNYTGNTKKHCHSQLLSKSIWEKTLKSFGKAAYFNCHLLRCCTESRTTIFLHSLPFPFTRACMNQQVNPQSLTVSMSTSNTNTHLPLQGKQRQKHHQTQNIKRRLRNQNKYHPVKVTK